MCHFYFPINLKIDYTATQWPHFKQMPVLFPKLNIKLLQHIPNFLYLLNLFLLPPTSKMCFCVFTCTDIAGHIFLIIIVYLFTVYNFYFYMLLLSS